MAERRKSEVILADATVVGAMASAVPVGLLAEVLSKNGTLAKADIDRWLDELRSEQKRLDESEVDVHRTVAVLLDIMIRRLASGFGKAA